MFKILKNGNKFEGYVNGKLVSRATTQDKVEATLKSKYGMEGFDEEKKQAKSGEYFSVTERFDFIDQFVDMIRREVMTSLIITGEGGIGKSWNVLNSLKKRGLKQALPGVYEPDFIVIKGFSTAKAMYRTLFENNGKIIIFDDADSVHKDAIAANILKGALDSEKRRVITWGAEFSQYDDLPNSFEFTGRVIFISNLSLTKFPQALLSRALKVDLTLTQDEKIERIETVLQDVDCTEEDRHETLAFIKKYSDKFTDLNVRSALNVLKLKHDAGDGWERLALYTVSA